MTQVHNAKGHRSMTKEDGVCELAKQIAFQRYKNRATYLKNVSSFIIGPIASLLCWESKQAINNKTDTTIEHNIQRGRNKMLQRKKN